MPAPISWRQNKFQTRCPYCQGKEFSDTGYCTNCGAFLVVPFSRRWAPDRIPAIIQNPELCSLKCCFLCGSEAQEFGAYAPISMQAIMTADLLVSSPVGLKAKQFREQVLDRAEEQTTRALILGYNNAENLLFPTSLSSAYSEEETILGLKDTYFCRCCAEKELLDQAPLLPEIKEEIPESHVLIDTPIEIPPAKIAVTVHRDREEPEEYWPTVEDLRRRAEEEELTQRQLRQKLNPPKPVMSAPPKHSSHRPYFRDNKGPDF